MVNEYFGGDFSPPSAEEDECVRLLGLIDAEWRSDPQSVVCFDRRIIEGVRKAIAAHAERTAKVEKYRQRFLARRR